MQKHLLLLLFSSLILFGCSSNSEVTEKVNMQTEAPQTILDVTKFSRISAAELVELLGEPDSISDFPWTVISTNKKITGKLYAYENNKIEFILFDDQVARVTYHSDNYLGYGETSLSFSNERDIFSLFGITPGDRLKKVADTGYALRYTPVSENVAEVWVTEISEGKFDIAKITYNLNYFN